LIAPGLTGRADGHLRRTEMLMLVILPLQIGL
jgi:hypothetical protein